MGSEIFVDLFGMYWSQGGNHSDGRIDNVLRVNGGCGRCVNV